MGNLGGEGRRGGGDCSQLPLWVSHFLEKDALGNSKIPRMSQAEALPLLALSEMLAWYWRIPRMGSTKCGYLPQQRTQRRPDS